MSQNLTLPTGTASSSISTAPTSTADLLHQLAVNITGPLHAQRHAARLAAKYVLDAAEALRQAREICSKDEWAACLQAQGIDAPTLSTLQELDRMALDPDAVVRLGGAVMALALGALVQRPAEDEVLAVRATQGLPEGVAVYVWRADGGFCVGRLDIDNAATAPLVIRRPMVDERTLWATVWALLGPLHHVATFHVAEDLDGSIVAALEAERQAILKEAPRVH